MARRKLTTFSKFLITMAVAGGLFLGFIQLRDSGALDGILNTDNTKTVDKSKKNTKVKKGDVINIGVVTWGGYAGGQYFNEGFDANTNSRFYKDYGFQVQFEVLDDYIASRKAFEKGDVDLLWTTIDAFPTESGQLGGDPQVVFQADWSRGGDAVVVRRGINRVSDLKGKKICVAQMTPSHTFLLWLLEAGDLKPSDVELILVDNAIDAAAAFKAQSVDAAVVWSPDDEDCLRAVSGSRVLENTRSASNIIADVFLAKKEYIDNNEERLQQLYEGWMKGAAEINTDDANKRKAAKILADGIGFNEDDAYKAINNVRLCTHGDNENFFGLNYDYKGIKGDDLYTKMTGRYTELGFIEERPPSWRLIARPDAIRATTSLTGAEHAAEGQKKFVPVKDAKDKEAIATKRLSITFPSGSYQLDDNAKYIIDLNFVDIAKTFSNSYIRIEGNTDNVGSRTSNVALSEKRAQAVADYLHNEHDMPTERFIVIGNGPDKPVADNSSDDGRRKNRRTEFELVSGE